MKKALLALMMAAMAMDCAAADQQATGMGITVLGPKSPRPERYLVGETVTFRVVVANQSEEPIKLMFLSRGSLSNPDTGWVLHVDGDAVGSPCQYVNERLRPIPPLTTVAPHDEYVMTSGPNRSLGAGRHEVWVEYEQPAGRLNYFAGQEGIVKDRVVSNRFHFEIVEPEGVDALVVEKFGSGRFCNDILVSESRRQEIVEEFPASRYAGLALSSGQGFHQYAPPPVPLGMIGNSKEMEERRRSNKLTAERQLERLARLKRYLTDRPDFDGADRLWFDVAWIQAYLGEHKESRRTLESLLAKSDLPPWLRQQCERLRDYFDGKSEEAKQGTSQPGARQ